MADEKVQDPLELFVQVVVPAVDVDGLDSCAAAGQAARRKSSDAPGTNRRATHRRTPT
jgi:hypothetical protein